MGLFQKYCLNEEKSTAWSWLADQLVNAWEVNSPEEMFDHIASDTKFDKPKLKKLIDKWYNMGGRERHNLSMLPSEDLHIWLMKEME